MTLTLIAMNLDSGPPPPDSTKVIVKDKNPFMHGSGITIVPRPYSPSQPIYSAFYKQVSCD